MDVWGATDDAETIWGLSGGLGPVRMTQIQIRVTESGNPEPWVTESGSPEH